jgi:hypothetical protein
MAVAAVAVDSMAAADMAADMAAADIGNPSASGDVETAVSSYADSRFICESSMLSPESRRRLSKPLLSHFRSLVDLIE